MGNHIAQGQEANRMPPRVGSILAITLDTTSRRYDLGAVALGGKDIVAKGELFVSLISTVAFYIATNSTNAGTVDETAALAAGGTVSAFTTNGAWLVPANTEVRLRLDRVQDRYLVVKGSGAGIVRIYASSDTTGRSI